MRIIFYYDDCALNDATRYYVGLIEKAAGSLGLNFLYVTKMPRLGSKDLILTITCKYYVLAKVKCPKNKIIFWAQGIVPEEYLMGDKINIFKFYFISLLERISIQGSDLLLVVSESMLAHFKNKYRIKDSKCLIIPCYNLGYVSGLPIHTSSRYEHPTFVYAGSMHRWQCLEKTLVIFKRIQHAIPSAKITILVREIDEVLLLLRKMQIKNAVVKYVPLDKLQSELLNYKYGFIIRDNIIVNNVATPTKMNSYLASGVIPIYTDAVNSFVENIDLGKEYTICVDSNNCENQVIETIVRLESRPISVTDLDFYINKVFIDYYNSGKHILLISENLKKMIQ